MPTGTVWWSALTLVGTCETLSLMTPQTELATLEWAAVEAERLMSKHLSDGWRFEWDRAQRRLGCTHFMEAKITLSRILTPRRTQAAVTNTILHEIAHAIVGPVPAAHGAIWKGVARDIGCTAERCSNDVVVDYKWAVHCNGCGARLARRLRKTDLKYRYSTCCNQALHWREL